MKLKKGKQYLLWGKYLASYVGERQHRLLGRQFVFEFEVSSGSTTLVEADATRNLSPSELSR